MRRHYLKEFSEHQLIFIKNNKGEIERNKDRINSTYDLFIVPNTYL